MESEEQFWKRVRYTKVGNARRRRIERRRRGREKTKSRRADKRK